MDLPRARARKWVPRPSRGRGEPSRPRARGGAADDLLGHRLSFTGDRFVIRSAGGEVLYRGSFEANPAKEPPTIDFRHEADPLPGTTWLGVYRIEGGKLRICDNAADPARPRPTGFDPKPGSGAVLVTFERVTP